MRYTYATILASTAPIIHALVTTGPNRQRRRNNIFRLRILKDGHITTTTEIEPPLFDKVPERENSDDSFQLHSLEGQATDDEADLVADDSEDDDWAFAAIGENAESIFLEGDTAATSMDVSSVRDEDDILTEREDRMYKHQEGKEEECILVGVEDLSYKRKSSAHMADWESNNFSLEESLTEMRELIKTAGLKCVSEVTQRLNDRNPRTYVGTGKVKEIGEIANTMKCPVVVFDAELSPGQQKQLENAFNKKILQNDFLGSVQDREIKVIDRTALILDIFAQHAKTREGKLQVELALNIYRKPRLTKMWTHLERQSGAGGVGLRGPGESQLEIDKRLVRDRIITLKRSIDNVQKQRHIHRKGRENLGLPIIALIGYTNAGKSTLLNYLTRAGVLAESMLFATLDPTTRRVKLPGLKTHPEVLLTDTVGFIQALPTQLVAAFRATLEEVKEADVLVHVIDVSNPVWRKQEASVLKVLGEMGVADKPILRVWNKIDSPGLAAEDLKYEAAVEDSSVAVSALSGDGMEDFVASMEDALSSLLEPIEVEIPYSKGVDLNLIHEVGAVEVVDYRENGTYVRARVPKALANRLQPYFVGGALFDDVEETSKLEPNEEDGDIDWVAIGRGRHPKRASDTEVGTEAEF